MLAWALFSVARKGAVCYCSISELTGLKGQFDAIAATLMGFLEKDFFEERKDPALF